MAKSAEGSAESGEISALYRELNISNQSYKWRGEAIGGEERNGAGVCE